MEEIFEQIYEWKLYVRALSNWGKESTSSFKVRDDLFSGFFKLLALR